MPRISQLPFDVRAVSLSLDREAKRSPGIHLSTIIKDRLITAGIERKVKSGKAFSPEELHLIFERGFLWERMIAEFCDSAEWLRWQLDEAAGRHFAQGMLEKEKGISGLVRPGECQLDGIYMTPDAAHITEGRIEEYKATGMRYKGFDIEARRPEWLWQAGSYAQVFGMTKAVFRIWHVSDGIINSLLVEWEQEEVSENWRRMKDHWTYMQERNSGNRP